MRPAPFLTNYYYHVYCRGVEKRRIFYNSSHYYRFLNAIRNILTTGSATSQSILNQGLALKHLKQNEQIPLSVTLLCYCLMPNHYHLLLRQDVDSGVTDFMHKINTSYSMFFNLNFHRKGRLLENTFKAKIIETDETLIHVSRYIHLNPLIGGITDNLDKYQWSSYPDYIGLRNDTLCNSDIILSKFSNKTNKYIKFVLDQVDYAFQLKNTKSTENEEEDSLFL